MDNIPTGHWIILSLSACLILKLKYTSTIKINVKHLFIAVINSHLHQYTTAIEAFEFYLLV